MGIIKNARSIMGRIWNTGKLIRRINKKYIFYGAAILGWSEHKPYRSDTRWTLGLDKQMPSYFLLLLLLL